MHRQNPDPSHHSNISKSIANGDQEQVLSLLADDPECLSKGSDECERLYPLLTQWINDCLIVPRQLSEEQMYANAIMKYEDIGLCYLDVQQQKQQQLLQEPDIESGEATKLWQLMRLFVRYYGASDLNNWAQYPSSHLTSEISSEFFNRHAEETEIHRPRFK